MNTNGHYTNGHVNGAAPAAGGRVNGALIVNGSAFFDGKADEGWGEMAGTQVRSVPSNLGAERAVLGSLLIDSDAIVKVGNFLRAEDFYRQRHGWIYEAMLSLNERREPIDFVTLTDELERHERLEETGGPAYITDLIDATPTSLYVDYYARIVEQAAVRRRLITAAGKIAETAHDEATDLDDVLDEAGQQLLGVSTGRAGRDMASVRAMLREIIDGIERRGATEVPVGLPTGFKAIDTILGGLQKSDLIIIGGRPGMGKSGLALSIARNAAVMCGARVAMFSLEMSAEQQIQRLLSMESGIDSHRLRLGQVHEDEWQFLMEAANILSKTSIFADDTPGASVNEIRSKSRRLYAEHGLDLIIVDYMQLMSGGSGRRENRQQEISYISRSLKGLARELNTPVIALSQLSRAVESRADKRPMMSDLRESGDIENDADAVMFVYREDYYIPDTSRQSIADVIVAKHRHGSTGTASLYFRKELTQFKDLEILRKDLFDGAPARPLVSY